MSEMVERVAQAICGDGNPANVLGIHRDRARLAIAAMREPTEDMCNEAECAEPFSFESMWRAAIDEALK